MQYSNIIQISSIVGNLIPILLIYLIASSLFFTYKFFTTENDLKVFCKKKMQHGMLYIMGTILLWGVIGLFGNVMGVGQSGSASMPVIMGSTYGTVNTASISIPTINFRDQYNQRENISDTRSYIKRSFSATLKTREVEKTANKVENLVEDKNGRIDSSNISKNFAHISFVIPKSELGDFKEQLKTYTNAKLYEQTITSENLLGEKKNLEGSQRAASSGLDTLSSAKKRTEAEYQKASADLQSLIANKNSQLRTLNANIAKKETELSSATNTEIIKNLSAQSEALRRNRISVTDEIYTVSQQLVAVNDSYNSQISNLNSGISNQVNTLSNLNIQTENFLDKIETVECIVTISFVTYFELFDAFSPIPLSGIIITIIVLFMFYRTYNTFKSYKSIAPHNKN